MSYRSRLTRAVEEQRAALSKMAERRRMLGRRRNGMTRIGVTRAADAARQQYHTTVSKYADLHLEYVAEMDKIRAFPRAPGGRELTHLEKLAHQIQADALVKDLQNGPRFGRMVREMSKAIQLMQYWEEMERKYGMHAYDLQVAIDPRPYWKKQMDIRNPEHPWHEKQKQYFVGGSVDVGRGAKPAGGLIL